MSLVDTFHYVYVLQNAEGLYCTGCASNLRKRLAEHNSGKSRYTNQHAPYGLIYYEACLNSRDAYQREKYLKTGMGKRYLKNRVKTQLKEGAAMNTSKLGMNPVRVLENPNAIPRSETEVTASTYQLITSQKGL